MITNNEEKSIILYAEDDEDDQQLVKEFEMCVKDQWEADFLTADDGQSALNLFNSNTDYIPDFIFLDVNMPKMNGIEALKQIRKNKRYAKTPAILFTTSSQLQDKNFATQYNAGFITKPIDSTQMKRIAEKFLEHCERK